MGDLDEASTGCEACDGELVVVSVGSTRLSDVISVFTMRVGIRVEPGD